ncbi:RagB/SusD family nutrient uptake outer membrane protein [Ferruginibacter sp. HRS2-29]|uniref:RagB/SusD family nutrient uptake outer membrane protein n=1 Tax=Ferruginibacter sp. HRS2-29 TaxID=2487334 RepID=UPI0020CD4D41|nr:RagB/SusD family nutrient uptake outer membrane protein [Ferruginibacter sp. HRS2-29]MCP9752000.1 RagB/SusD family nutrient uptake outer membrane protein [Ferruginibacter sp. HRS2-29]
MKTRLQKKWLVSALVITAILFAVSCKKYLDVKPVSYFDTEFTFDNVNNAQKAVLGAYASAGGDNGYGIRISMYYPLDDDIMMGQGGTPYPDNERRDIAHYNVTPTNTQLAAPFNQLYQGIERANLCIYYIPQMPQYTSGTNAEQSQLKRLHGEALTLRALYYLELVRNWGDVPAQWAPSFSDNDFYKSKTDRDTIYNHLLDDLKTAETLVPWRTEVAIDERITQGAVRALRARIALYRGGYSLRRSKQMVRGSNHLTYYQIAKEECAAIMSRRDQHKLNTSYQSVFKDNICAHRIETNGEVLFEIAMAGGSSATGDSKLGYYNGTRYNNVGNSALTVLPSYFYAFDSTDSRRDVMCAIYNVNSNGTFAGRTAATMVDGKFRRDWITPSVVGSAAQYFGLNWPVIRFSDVLLMFAEADNELNNGPSADAISAYNEVRARAFAANPSYLTNNPAPTTYSGFFNAIVQERALELGGEGIRKYDLIRWNLLGTKLAETKLTLAAMAARTTAPWNTYPTTMYYNKLLTSGLVWAGSFYKPNVTPAPATSTFTGVNWLHSSINSTISLYYAVSFTPNKSELLPLAQSVLDGNRNLTQDYGY